jgi:hypothetical protein
MANEVTISYPSGQTLYYIIRRADGHAWDTTGDAFEDWNVMTDYDISMTDETGSFYQANFDTDVSAGVYTVQIFLQTGGGPVDADPLLASRLIYWDGSAEVSAAEYALQVNTIAEMAAGAPPLAPTIVQILNFLYRLFRNKTTTTSTLLTVRNDADGADLFKSTLANDGTTFTKSEYVSG